MRPSDDLDLASALEELGLSASNSSSSSEPLDAAAIRAAFRRRAKEIHPDLNPNSGAAEAARQFSRLSRAAEVALAAGRPGSYSHFQHAGAAEPLLSSLLRQRRVALGLSAALVVAGGGALWLALGVHRDRYSKEVAAVVRQPPSEAALAVSRMVEEARVEARRDLRLRAKEEAEKAKSDKS